MVPARCRPETSSLDSFSVPQYITPGISLGSSSEEYSSSDEEDDEDDDEEEPSPSVSLPKGTSIVHPVSKAEVTVPVFVQKEPLPRTFAAVKAPKMAVEPVVNPQEEARLRAVHLSLLQIGTELQGQQEISSAPVFTPAVQNHIPGLFTQYGFLGGISKILDEAPTSNESTKPESILEDPRLFFNIAAPSSAFICGSQGSGKSHTLSCLLENCLMKSDVSKLQNPLAGLVFHYDTFTSDIRGTPCEAAYLASNPAINVRVLCSPTNYHTIKRTYEGLNVKIERLHINQSDLNTKRMLDLMAVNQDDGAMPLYLHAITRILREMRLIQQETNGFFNYADFKRKVADSAMTPAQQAPLQQRLDTLESFMPKSQTDINARSKKAVVGGIDWTVKPGNLTIVDLSCPCVTAEGACALFDMCLSLFLEQNKKVGRVVALDEAHKYMSTAPSSATLTNTLLSSIRLQRHLGTRIFISTQEPTISPSLLDLCSVTIVHRFSSPAWLLCLKDHLAAVSSSSYSSSPQYSPQQAIFSEIVKLRVGEALLFAPSAIIGVSSNSQEEEGEAERRGKGEEDRMKRLGTGYLKIKIRARITEDGGKSVLAT